MDYKDLDQLARRIYTGLSIVEYDGRLFFIHDPRPQQQMLARMEYDKFFHNAVLEGVPTREQLIDSLSVRGIWSTEKQEELDSIDDKILKLEKEYSQYEFQRNKKLLIQEGIKKLKTRKQDLENILRKATQHCAESLADSYQNKYLLFLCTKDINGNQVWSTFLDFREQVKEEMGVFLLRHSLYDERLNEKHLRLVARKEPWRSIWLSSVKTGNLFDHSKAEMTDLQRVLVTWSIAYDNVYEHPECPPDSIIQDDELLDIWFKEQNDKMQKSKNNENIVSKITKNKKIQNSENIGIVVDSPEEAQRVYGLNDKLAMGNIRAREEFLKDKGTAREWQMPDTRREMQLQANQMRIQGIKDGSNKKS